MSTIFVDNLRSNLSTKITVPSGNTLDVSGATFTPPAGHVIQTVQDTYDNQISTTSTTYVTSNLAATITPTSANSKILINVNVGVYNPAGQYIRATVYRGSTELANDAKSGSHGAKDAFIANSGSGSNWITSGINYLDSPATTSATTYTVYYKSTSGTAYIHNGWTVSTMTLMEIAG